MSRLAHEDAAAELEAVALGAAGPGVAEAVREHAAECEECARELDEFTRLVTELSALVPERPLNRGRSAGIRSRLLARSHSDAEIAVRRARTARATGQAPTVVAPPRLTADEPRSVEPALPPPILAAPPPGTLPRRASGTRRWAVAAIIAFLAATALLARTWLVREPSTASVAARDDSLAARADSLERALEEKERALAVISAPGVRIISLTNWSSLRRPLARMFWDPRTGRWTLMVYELRQPRPGKAYEVWLVTRGKRIPAGMFRPRPDGTAMMEMTHAMEPGTLQSIAVTEEPASGMDTPTGPVVLAGSPAQ